MFERARRRLARLIAPNRPAKLRSLVSEQFRMYAGAKSSRLTTGFGTSASSADSELSQSLTALRSRSRQLVRDAPYAKRAKLIIQNNIVGAGIGLQAQVKNARGKLNKRLNDEIEKAYSEWARAENCHTGGALHFHDIERMCIGQTFEAGEMFIRKHYRKFGESRVPLALEIIEPERLADDYSAPAELAAGNLYRMGIELDEYHRPVAYHFRTGHSGETRWGEYSAANKIERVPAEQVIHLRLVDRWPQTRGEPWLHAVLRKLNDIDGYSEAEIIAARAAAMYVGFIETPDDPRDETAGGKSEIALEPGMFEHLAPGEKFAGYSPNRPNSGADPFLRFMLREIAAGAGVSYESLSRDYSQSNYSSSRLSLLDDRDLWRILQQWFIRSVRDPIHREFVRLAAMSRAINGLTIQQYAAEPERYAAARYKPRGWGWIDPTKEVAAYQQAVLAGFTTVGNVIAQTAAGMDLEDVMEERRAELDLMAEAGLKFSTEYSAPAPAPPDDKPGDESGDDQETNRPGDEPGDDQETNKPGDRVLKFTR